MADTYANFAALAAAEVYGIDYFIENTDVAGARVMCMAIHGGGIEVGTTELAFELSKLGVRKRKYYSFNATKPPGQNGTLHITSTNFDEPQAILAVTNAYRCLSFHGYFDVVPGETVCYMGGRDTNLRERIAKKLLARGFDARVAPDTVIGKEAGNIANTTLTTGGVQLELTTSLRDSFFVGGAGSLSNRQNKTAAFWNFLAAINDAILEVEMGKQSGLGDQLYVDGIDLSGDVGSLSRIGGGPSLLEVTAINKSAPERIGGIRDGAIEYNSWFNPAVGASHPNHKTLPYSDRILTYMRGQAVNAPAASMIGKQINYDPTRGQDGGLSFAVSAQANSYGLEWGLQGLAGKQTDNTTYTANDTFTRTTSNGWGTSDTGGAYATTGGTSADFSTDGTQGTIALPGTKNVSRRAILPVSIKDVDFTTNMTWNQTSTGGFVAGGVYLRYVDANNHLNLRVEASSVSNALNFTLRKLVSSVSTDIVASMSLAKTYVSGTAVKVRFLAVGNQRKVKVWTANTAEPLAWDYEVVDTDNNAAGGVGIQAITSNANTDANATVSFDNLRAHAPFRGLPVDTGTGTLAFGLQAYYHFFTMTGNQILAWLEQSSDDGNSDPYDKIPGTEIGPITTTTGQAVRIQTSLTQSVRRYIRLAYSTSTGLTSVTHALQIVKNATEVKF